VTEKIVKILPEELCKEGNPGGVVFPSGMLQLEVHHCLQKLPTEVAQYKNTENLWLRLKRKDIYSPFTTILNHFGRNIKRIMRLKAPKT